MNLIKRGAGKNWTAVWTWRGKKYCRSTGVSSRKRAESVAAGFLSAQKNDRLDLLESSKLRRTLPSIAQILAIYPTVATCRKATAVSNVSKLRQILRVLGISESESILALGAGVSVKFQNAERSRGLSPTAIVSTLRIARSVFARRLLPAYGLQELPEWLKAPNPKASPIRGFQPIPWASWVQIVRGVHALDDPAIYRAFLLMARCGLGNDEVIHSRGTWLAPHGIRIEPREWKRRRGKKETVTWEPKSHNRIRTVPMREIRYERFFAEFEGLDVLLVPDGFRRIYHRMNPVIRAALPGRTKCSYELRKLAGSVVATRGGIYEAARFLGDRVDTCEKYYAALLKPLKAI